MKRKKDTNDELGWETPLPIVHTLQLFVIVVVCHVDVAVVFVVMDLHPHVHERGGWLVVLSLVVLLLLCVGLQHHWW